MRSRGLKQDFSQSGSLSSLSSLPLLLARSAAYISPDDTTQAAAQRHGDKEIMGNHLQVNITSQTSCYAMLGLHHFRSGLSK